MRTLHGRPGDVCLRRHGDVPLQRPDNFRRVIINDQIIQTVMIHYFNAGISFEIVSAGAHVMH